jgi:hypothetical protein
MNANARRLLDEAMHGEAGGLSDVWRAEVARRICRVDAGETELLDVEDVERELWSEQLADAAEQRR